MRALIKRLPHRSTVVDFEETLLRQSVRATTRLWHHGDTLVGFAFVDDFNNLRFEVDPARTSAQLETEIIEWGIACVGKRNAETGQAATLDACFSVENRWHIGLLERFGFAHEPVRSLKYARSLDEPITGYALPQGFAMRPVGGEAEVEKLAMLHRAAFDTGHMTVEARLAIMRAPDYAPDLDLVAVAPNGDLAAFCICGLEEEEEKEESVGYTDPIGTHPRYQRLGLAKALVTAGLSALKERGVTGVELGTSSENIPMQRLAELLGFVAVSEKLWFSKTVTT